MRTGISIEFSPEDRRLLQAVVKDRNAPQKHVWRARIVLLTADGHGTVEIMRRAGTSKVAVWRWQERFMTAGIAGLHVRRREAEIRLRATEANLARLEDLKGIIGVFVRLERPLDYDSVDRQPVDLVFGLFAPKDSGVDHLKALALVSRTMRDPSVVAKLRANSDPSKLHAILTESRAPQAA